jgi:hypothetical protein
LQVRGTPWLLIRSLKTGALDRFTVEATADDLIGTGMQPSENMTIGQLGHHRGLRVTVDLRGMTIGGVFTGESRWVSGTIAGPGSDGSWLRIQLDVPIGGGERRGVFGRQQRAQDAVVIDDPARVRPLELPEDRRSGTEQDVAALVRAGKTLEAVKKYRAATGATMEEARAFIARL